jgi:hydrogenase nickel incorporation protein HypB
MFLGSDVVVINKIDLAEIMDVKVEQLIRDVHTLKPDIRVVPASCKTGAGLDEIAALLTPRETIANA